MRHAVRSTWIHPTQNHATCGLQQLHKSSECGEAGTSIADMSTRADSQFGIQNNEPLDSYPERLDIGRTTPSI